jgi:hypothetical protein
MVGNGQAAALGGLVLTAEGAKHVGKALLVLAGS